MSNLRLTSLSVEIFSDADQLNKIILSHNKLSEIPSRLLYKNVKFSEVDFSYDKAKVIDEYAFAGDFNLEEF